MDEHDGEEGAGGGRGQKCSGLKEWFELGSERKLVGGAERGGGLASRRALASVEAQVRMRDLSKGGVDVHKVPEELSQSARALKEVLRHMWGVIVGPEWAEGGEAATGKLERLNGMLCKMRKTVENYREQVRVKLGLKQISKRAAELQMFHVAALLELTDAPSAYQGHGPLLPPVPSRGGERGDKDVVVLD